VATGGFDLDFGASLGNLAGVETSGSVIPLVGLFAHATFGINLSSPSQASDVSPNVFQPGPRVDVLPAQEGGRSVRVETVRPGNGSAAEIQVLTVRGGGTFGVSSGGTTVTGLSADISDADLASQLNSHGIAVASVVKVVRPEGNVYRITFSGTGNRDELAP